MPRTPADAPASAPAPDRDAAGRRGDGGARTVLAAGVVVTAAATLALLGALIAYAADAPASPALFRLVLFGYPVGFGLMLLHLVLAGLRRRRL